MCEQIFNAYLGCLGKTTKWQWIEYGRLLVDRNLS